VNANPGTAAGAPESGELLEDLPLFPLKTVLFPGGRLPLRIFEARYLDMAREVMKTGAPFGVCRIRSGAEVGEAAEPETVGTLATLVDCDMEQLGLLTATARGAERFRIRSSRVNRQGLLIAQAERIAPADDGPLPDRLRACAQLVQAIGRQQPVPIFFDPPAPESTRWVSYRLAEILPLPGPVRQHLLEMDHSLMRLDVLMSFLEKHGLVIRGQ
jgi:Lon protease-like protein